MAIQFNLLPWREERRIKKAQFNQRMLLSAGVLGVLLSGAYYGYETIRLEDHTKAYQFLKKKNDDIQKDLKEKKELDTLKALLNNQIDSIEALQADRASVSHMVEQLSEANNQQISLTRFSLQNGRVSISGIAENDAEVADLMKQLRRSEWYQEPRLVSITSNSTYKGEIKNFAITSRLLLPGKDKKEK